jgi:hypothetical protein
MALDPKSFDLEYGCVELHDNVVDMFESQGELVIVMADGSRYLGGISDQGKLVVHIAPELLNS